jgi:hypothetical protein
MIVSMNSNEKLPLSLRIIFVFINTNGLAFSMVNAGSFLSLILCKLEMIGLSQVLRRYVWPKLQSHQMVDKIVKLHSIS